MKVTHSNRQDPLRWSPLRLAAWACISAGAWLAVLGASQAAADIIDCGAFHQGTDQYLTLHEGFYGQIESRGSIDAAKFQDDALKAMAQIEASGIDAYEAIAIHGEIMAEAVTSATYDGSYEQQVKAGLRRARQAFLQALPDCEQARQAAGAQNDSTVSSAPRQAASSPPPGSQPPINPSELANSPASESAAKSQDTHSSDTAAAESIRQLQAVLNGCGFDAGPEDGIWGRRTRSAAEQYIRAHGEPRPAADANTLMIQADSYRVGDAGPCPKPLDAAADLASSSGSATQDSAADMPAVNQANQQLAATDFSSRNISGGDFSGADLTLADLSNADAAGADFSNATLLRANFENANLANADFSNADLTGTNLKNARVTGADFSGADLHGVDLSGSASAAASFANANVNQGRFDNADLTEADFQGANLSDASFKNSVLDKANLIGADLRSTVMQGASVAGAALASARVSAATGLTLAQVGTAKWAGEITKKIHEKSLADLKQGVKKLFSIEINREDGSYILVDSHAE